MCYTTDMTCLSIVLTSVDIAWVESVAVHTIATSLFIIGINE